MEIQVRPIAAERRLKIACIIARQPWFLRIRLYGRENNANPVFFSCILPRPTEADEEGGVAVLGGGLREGRTEEVRREHQADQVNFTHLLCRCYRC